MKSNATQRLSCEQVRSYLDSYRSDELLVETNHEMQTHLESCRACSAESEERKLMKSLLQRAVQSEVAPAALRGRIQQQIRLSRPPVHLFGMTGQRMALAASLAIVIGLGTWGAVAMWHGERNLAATLTAEYNPTLSEAAMRVLDIGLGDHVHCAVDNSFNVKYIGYNVDDLRAEYAELVPMVRAKIGAGFEVAAAHHCRVGEREFMHLIMQNREATISFVITRKNGEEFPADERFASIEESGTRLYSGRTREYAVTGFEAGEHLAFVASNLGAEENLRVASSIAPGVLDLHIR